MIFLTKSINWILIRPLKDDTILKLLYFSSPASWLSATILTFITVLLLTLHPQFLSSRGAYLGAIYPQGILTLLPGICETLAKCFYLSKPVFKDRKEHLPCTVIVRLS